MRLALKDAELSPEDIGYVNAHGTSTQINDATETLAIKKVFGDHARKLMVSSTKSMTGHMLGAAGGVETAICALTIARGVVPPDHQLHDARPRLRPGLRAQHRPRGPRSERADQQLRIRRHQRLPDPEPLLAGGSGPLGGPTKTTSAAAGPGRDS